MAYTARYERDESGWWTVEVPEVQGCRSQGRTLREARERIQEALGLFVDDAEAAMIVDDIRLPPEGRQAVERMTAARSKADAAARDAATIASDVAGVLTKRLGFSVRDAAGVLGLSHQRVQQLAASSRGRTVAERASGARGGSSLRRTGASGKRRAGATKAKRGG